MSATKNLRFLKFGRYLKKERLKQSLTQQDLATILNYHPQFVANWERGVSRPPAPIWKSLVTILKIERKDFIKNMQSEDKRLYIKAFKTK